MNKALCEDADRRFGSVGDFASALHALNVTDWTAETDSLHGEWSGVRRGSHSRDVVVKVAGELADGRSKGSVRLVALRETKGGWARFGIPDRLVKPENYPAAAKFFSAVEHKLDQLSATL